ncbi:MAG: replicative DNA helicase [Planctomycetaceae bacterium]|jgi:replicative DNA helicase|nr:replicative DNA helicase [Planctomycetaceae bacterium]
MVDVSERNPKKSKSSRKPNPSRPVDLSALENIPPHNLDAERGLIGSLLLNPHLCDIIVPLVHADDFYSDANRRIFNHLIEMRNDNCGIDLVLLLNRLQTSDELEAIGGEAYLAELMSSVHVTAHAEYYAKIVREKGTLRRLIHVNSGLIQDAFAPDVSTKDLLNKAASQMFELCEAQTTNQVFDIKSVMFDVGTYLDRKMNGETDTIKTGFIDLDEMTDGMHPNELIILAARPSVGKTALATNIAEYVSVNLKQTVLLVSLEMSRQELALRLICSRGKIDSNKIRKSFLSEQERNRFMETANDLSQAAMFIDDTPSRTVSEMAAVARRLKRQNDLRLLVIDYLGLIEPENPNDPRQEQVAKIARRLKGLARELRIPILCLAQLNRQADVSKDARPRLAHLRESGAIEQDADVVLFVHRPDKEMKPGDKGYDEVAGIAEIIIAKQRNGPIGEIKLNWVGEHTRFQNLSDKTIEEYSDFAEHSEVSHFDTYSSSGFNANFPVASDQIDTSEPNEF